MYCIFESWIYVILKIIQVLFLPSYGKMLKVISKKTNIKKTTLGNLRYTITQLGNSWVKKEIKTEITSFLKINDT